MKVKSVKEIKKLIDKVMLPGYNYKTNFSCPEFLIDINCKLLIAAKLVRYTDKVEYEFVLDVEFLSDAEVTYEELKMIKNIIDILIENRKFVLSRFKKYTVEEYDEEQNRKAKESEMMLEALENAILSMNN